MAKCPKCNAEIEELGFSAEVRQYGIYRLDNWNDAEWDTTDYGDWDNVIFYCNKCNEALFYDVEDAEQFLKKPEEKQEVLK
jgi:hypothetical protein